MNYKSCRACAEVFELQLFKKEKRNADGYASICKACASKQSSNYRNRNIEQRREYEASYREANREVIRFKANEFYRSDYEQNKERYQSRSKKWRDSNPHKIREKAARRRAVIKQRSFILNEEYRQQVKDIYMMAALLERVIGEAYHVDHIVPLVGKEVCGLHVPWNLQIIPASENLSKANKLVPQLSGPALSKKERHTTHEGY